MCSRTGNGAAYVQFQFAVMIAPFDQKAMIAELARRVNVATGRAIRAEAKYPSLRFAELEASERLQRLLEVLDWVLGECDRAAQAS